MGLGENGKIPDDDEATCRTGKLDHKHKQGCGRLGPVPLRNSNTVELGSFPMHEERKRDFVHTCTAIGTWALSQRDTFSVSNLKNIPY